MSESKHNVGLRINEADSGKWCRCTFSGQDRVHERFSSSGTALESGKLVALYISTAKLIFSHQAHPLNFCDMVELMYDSRS